MSVVQELWLQPHVFWLLKYMQRYVRNTGRGAIHSTMLNLQSAKNDFESLTAEEKQPVLNRSWSSIKNKWNAICHNFQPPQYLILLRASNDEISEWARLLSVRGINDIKPSNPWTIDQYKQYSSFCELIESFHETQFISSPLIRPSMMKEINATYSTLTESLKSSLTESNEMIINQSAYFTISEIVNIIKLMNVNVAGGIFAHYIQCLKNRMDALKKDEDIANAADTLDDTAILQIFKSFNTSNNIIQRHAFEIMKKYTKYFMNPLIAEQGVQLLDNQNVGIEIEEIMDFLQDEPRDNLINSGILDKMGGYIQYNTNDIILEKAAKFVSFLCGSKILNQSDSYTILNYLQFLLSLNCPNLLSHALAGYKRIFDGYYHGKIEKENIESIGKVFIEQFMEEKDLKLAGIITATQKQDTLLSNGYIRNKEYELDLFGIDNQIPFVINGVVNQYYNNWYGQKPDQMKLNVVSRLCQLISFGDITNDFMYKLISVINISLCSASKAAKFNAGDLSIMARIYLKHDIVNHLFEISKRGKYRNCCIKIIIAMNILLRMCDNDAIESNNVGPAFMEMLKNIFKQNIEINGSIENSVHIELSLKKIQGVYNYNNDEMISYLDELLRLNGVHQETVSYIYRLQDQFKNKSL